MKELQDFNLNIYGNGGDREDLETLVKESNLKNVFLYGGTNQVKEKLDENGILLDKEWNEDKFVEATRKVYDNYEYYLKNSIKMGKNMVLK